MYNHFCLSTELICSKICVITCELPAENADLSVEHYSEVLKCEFPVILKCNYHKDYYKNISICLVFCVIIRKKMNGIQENGD